ncbi:MAG: MazG nucleotide pyrophosphohydrolase domain-containing protein [Planctomycetota bacterium]
MPTSKSDSRHPSNRPVSLKDFQRRLAEIYLEKDSRRGLDGTFMYFVSEVGELAQALRDGDNVEEEFADCLAWLISLANIADVDLQECMEKIYLRCPDCGCNPCICHSKP